MSDEHLEAVHKKLKSLRERTDLSLRPTTHLKTTFTGFDGEEHPLALRYYQVQGVLHLVAMKRFLLGDDTGLGKTLQSIGALCYLWEKDSDQKAIILTNKSAVQQWAGEFQKFTSGVKTIVCKGTPAQRKKAYDLFEATMGPTVLQNWSDYVLICDEATAFKTTTTQVHQVVHHLSHNASRTWALTATLIKNNLMEGWGIYRVVVPGLFETSKNKFMLNYCIIRMQKIPRSNRQIPVITGYRQSDIDRFKSHIDPYFLGRPKFLVASDLPVLTRKVVKVDMTKDQNLKYQEALSGLLEVGIGDDVEVKETTKLTQIIYCQQIVNHLALIECEGKSAKLEALMELVKEGDFADEKIIIFSRFRKMIDIICPELEKAGIGYARVTGSETEDQRKSGQDAFQDPTSDTRIMCITAAGTEAINLQAARATIFYDTPWSGGEYIQSVGRMIRIGSVHDRCYAVHLVTRGSVDVRVMEVLSRKMKLIESVIGKRIQGEEDGDVEILADNDISDIFAMLQSDARGY
jgi:SNF2 family DNA or RNA helicase